MFGVEALNTAIEELVDRVSPEVSRTGKHAKDLGSFAVFCTLAAAGLYIAYVVFF
jgi:diacylglycerol kinase (ATP)